MTRLQREALVAEIADAMRSHGSWGGETHLQKATYVLQQLFGVPTAFSFVLYKHGPFSFDLRKEITAMQADGLIEQRPQPPYGPMLETTNLSKTIRSSNREYVAHYSAVIDRVAARLGALDVGRLEQISTAVYVLAQSPGLDDDQASEVLRSAKPHIDQDSASWAIAQARQIQADAGLRGSAPVAL